MYNNVPPQLWMQLPKDVKHHLVGIFKIPRTGVTEIRDQDVIADGYSVEDLRAITLEKMIAYIGSEETFPRAWEITCSKANSELHPPIEMTLPETNVIPMADEPKEEIIENKTKENVTTTKKNK